jgi:ABC-2 type transport system permease protein
MTTARLYTAAAMAIFKRDLIVFASYRLRSLSQLAAMCFTLTIFYFVSRLVRVQAFGNPDEYYAFVVVGIVIMAVLTSAISAPQMLQRELISGTFERLIASPLGAGGAVLAMLVFPILYSCLLAMGGMLFARVAFGLEVSWSTAPLALPVALLGAVAFGAIGLLFASSVIAFKQATGLNWVTALLALVGGVYFPVSLLPWWIAWASAVQPFTPAVTLLRHLLVGAPLNGSAWLELARLLGFVAVLVPLGLGLMSLALKAARRSGTILEY